MGRQFPGSWLPFGQEQVVRCAEPHFRLVSSQSGRLDYIETIAQWNARIGARSLRKTLLKLRLVPRWLTSADFRLAFTSGVSANKRLLRARAARPLPAGLREAQLKPRGPAQQRLCGRLEERRLVLMPRRPRASPCRRRSPSAAGSARVKANVVRLLRGVAEDLEVLGVGAGRHEHAGRDRDELDQLGLDAAARAPGPWPPAGGTRCRRRRGGARPGRSCESPPGSRAGYRASRGSR